MSLSQLIMTGVGIAVTFLGVVLAQRGKRGDQVIQQNKDQFDRLIEEATYWKGVASDARGDLDSFKDKQLARCRKVTDAAYQTIADLIRFVPPEQHRRADRTLGEIETHNETDHS